MAPSPAELLRYSSTATDSFFADISKERLVRTMGVVPSAMLQISALRQITRCRYRYNFVGFERSQYFLSTNQVLNVKGHCSVGNSTFVSSVDVRFFYLK
jgi:hypothetical protein